MTEEVKQSCDNCDDDGGCADDDTKDGKDEKDSKDEKEKDEKDEASQKYNDLIHYDRIHTAHTLASFSASNKITIWVSEDLIHLFTKDIHCPPPNC